MIEELSGLLGQPLRPHVANQSVKCPMHDDRVASMSISIPKGVWYCWGCDKGGTLPTLARFLGGEIDRTDYIVEANRNHEPEPEPIDFIDKYNEWMPIKVTTPEALTYARSKGISVSTLIGFGVRHDNRGNLVMPYFDGDRVVALRYRSRDGKKWYESGSERTIYNINQVRGAARVFLCEGESDTHSVFDLFQRVHMDSCVVGGIAGANSSIEKWELWTLDMMWAEEIYIGFDADEAGDKGAERAMAVIGTRAKRVRPTKANDWSDAIIAGEIPSVN